MVKRALCLMLLVAGCYEDRYVCNERTDCDLGQGGRCEIDDHCTQRELTCDTLRAYTEHSAELSNQCFDDTVVLLNACAGGQPAAKSEGACFTKVCEQLPACCHVGWTDACVQLAQETVECALNCDVRIALTATRGTVIEGWDVRWTGTEWTTEPRNDLEALSWVAPAPGSTLPRLAGSTGTELIIGESHLPIEAGRQYGAITSVAFDRDRRDTVVATDNHHGNKHASTATSSPSSSSTTSPRRCSAAMASAA
jgi:hypothetical protein